MAFMIRGIKTSLKRDLKEYYDGNDNLSRNDQNWTTVSTTEFVKTKWSTKSPYNNNYDLGNCSTTTNKKYRASTAAVAFAKRLPQTKKDLSISRSNIAYQNGKENPKSMKNIIFMYHN